MPTTNARAHVIPLGTETTITRATIFTTFGNSIRDVVPVANTTARTQLVTDLTAASQAPSSTKPLVVYRHDAPGLHRIEWTVDGTVWIPSSGVLQFATLTAANSWASSNSAYLTVGDIAVIAGLEATWMGSAWSYITAVVTYGTGWAATTGTQHAPRLIRTGAMVTLVGAVTSSTGYNYGNILTVPTAFQPPSTGTRFVGSAILSNGMSVEYGLTAGVLSVPTGYASGSVPVGNVHALHCQWVMD